MAHCK